MGCLGSREGLRLAGQQPEAQTAFARDLVMRGPVAPLGGGLQKSRGGQRKRADLGTQAMCEICV